MTFTVTKNRLPELLKATKQVTNFGRQKRILFQAASESGQRLQAMYKLHAPDGERWTEPHYLSPRGRTIVHGRPSKRQQNLKTLAESWQEVELSNTSDGVKFRVGTDNDTVMYLHYGTASHSIPRSGIITFYHIATNTPMFFGGFGERRYVNHPGTKPNPFIREVWANRGQAMVATQFERGVKEIIQPFRGFFGVS